MAEVTEEEECDGCNGADPRRRLDDSLLRQADGILLCLIAATMAPSVAVAESGEHDDVDACDPHQRVVYWAGGSGGRRQQRRRDRG